MVYRTSNSTVALAALLAGCFYLVAPVSNAGDKIEFSAPSPLLEVPRPEQVVRQSAMSAVTAIKDSLSRHQTPGADSDFVPAPAATIILPAQKKSDHFGWTAPFEEPPDQADRTNPSELDLFASKKATVHTNSWSRSTDSDSAFSKGDTWIRSDRDHSRFGTDSTQKDDGMAEDRLGGRFDERGGSDWLHALDNYHRPKEAERTHQESRSHGKEDFAGSFYQQSIGGFSQLNPLGQPDPLHSSAYSSVAPVKAWPDESLGGQNDQQALTQPTMPRPFDELPTATHPQRPLVREQPYSSGSRVQAAPINLPFPKRPGDLFQ
jgi:hypothetical protein